MANKEAFLRYCIPSRLLIAAALYLGFTQFYEYTDFILPVVIICSALGLGLVSYLYKTGKRTGLAGNEPAWWDRRIEIIILTLILAISIWSLRVDNDQYLLWIPGLIVLDVVLGLVQYSTLKNKNN